MPICGIGVRAARRGPRANAPRRRGAGRVHDPNQALHYADRVLVLREGRTVCNGSPHEVLCPAVLSELYEVSVRRAFDSDGIGFFGVLPAAARLPTFSAREDIRHEST